MRHGMRKFEVLDEFRKDPSATIRELAARLGIGVFICHYHLTNLEGVAVEKVLWRLHQAIGSLKSL